MEICPNTPNDKNTVIADEYLIMKCPKCKSTIVYNWFYKIIQTHSGCYRKYSCQYHMRCDGILFVKFKDRRKENSL